MQVKIEGTNVDLENGWKEEIEQRVADLESRHPITHARVALTRNKHHQQGDDVAEARVSVTMPPRQLMTSHKKGATFEEAIRAAFGAVELELVKFREKRAAN